MNCDKNPKNEIETKLKNLKFLQILNSLLIKTRWGMPR